MGGSVPVLVLGVVVLVEAGVGAWGQPYDYDEQNAAYEFVYRGWHRINPLRTETHPVAALSSFGMFKVFGPGKIEGRIPALIFSAVFLILLAYFGMRHFSPLTNILLFSHLAANHLFIWYAHSLRGYISMMLWCFLLFAWVYELCTSAKARFHPFLFFALFVGAILTHPFAGIFSIALWFTVLIWGCAQIKKRGDMRRENVKRIVVTGMIGLPFIVGLLYFNQKYVQRDPNLFIDVSRPTPLTFSFLAPIFSNLFGTMGEWYSCLIFLTALCILFLARGKTVLVNFSGLFLICFSVFFFSVFAASHGQMLVGRFFLAILPILIWWIGEGVSLSRFRKTLAIASFLLLVGVPMFSSEEITSYVADNHEVYDHFMREVKNRTSPNSRTCFWADGDKQKALVAVPLYLRPGKYGENSVNCTSRFYFHVAEERGIATEVSSMGENISKELLYSDGQGTRCFA